MYIGDIATSYLHPKDIGNSKSLDYFWLMIIPSTATATKCKLRISSDQQVLLLLLCYHLIFLLLWLLFCDSFFAFFLQDPVASNIALHNCSPVWLLQQHCHWN